MPAFDFLGGYSLNYYYSEKCGVEMYPACVVLKKRPIRIQCRKLNDALMEFILVKREIIDFFDGDCILCKRSLA